MTTITLAALKSEIQSDPTGVGYAAPVAAGADGAVADLLNAAGAGVAYSIYRKSVGIHEIIAAIDATNFGSLAALQVAKLQLLFAGTGNLDATDANTRAIATGIFTGMTATLTNLAALVKRQGSRAEVLWGDGARVTADLVSQARNS